MNRVADLDNGNEEQQGNSSETLNGKLSIPRVGEGDAGSDDDDDDDDDDASSSSWWKDSDEYNLKTHLSLSKASLSSATATTFELSRIIRLDLSHCGMDDDHATTKYLRSVLPFLFHLQELNLSWNRLTDVGARAIVSSLCCRSMKQQRNHHHHPKRVRFKSLNLSHNRLSLNGMHAVLSKLLSLSSSVCCLTSLHLFDHQVLVPASSLSRVADFIVQNNYYSKLKSFSFASERFSCTTRSTSDDDDDDPSSIMDDLCWIWQDAAYHQARDCICSCLRLNRSALVQRLLSFGFQQPPQLDKNDNDPTCSRQDQEVEREFLAVALEQLFQQEGLTGLFHVLQRRVDLLLRQRPC